MSDRLRPEFVLQPQEPPIIRPSFLFTLIIGVVAVILVALFAVN
jgi:hypothetical protein